MKVKRFVIEYANSKMREYEKLTGEYPENSKLYAKAMRIIDRAVRCAERGMITEDDAIRAILDSMANAVSMEYGI